MADDSPTTERSFLRRWSQRKLAASREAQAAERTLPPAAATTTAPGASLPASGAAPVDEALALPPVESLTFDSDFTAFLKPGVDAGLRTQALRKLFSDPRFNVMDGLDVYIDDYGKFEPIPPELVKQLRHAKYLFDPPKTRVNADGHVEDVPEEVQAAPTAAPDTLASPTQGQTIESVPAEPAEAIDKDCHDEAPSRPTNASAEPDQR